LVDPENTDLAGKQNVAATQSHEVAHMWFGDIVTMKWWDNLYLNEGMAKSLDPTGRNSSTSPQVSLPWYVASDLPFPTVLPTLWLDGRGHHHRSVIQNSNKARSDHVL